MRYIMKVEDVSEYVLPEINEEFYKKVFGDDTDIKDNDAFRARLRKDLEAEVAETSRTDLQNRAVEMVVKGAKVEVPDSLIERYAHSMRHDDEHWAQDNGVNLTEAYALDTEDGRKGYEKLIRDRAETAVRNVLIMDAAAKKFDVHLEQSDLDAEFQRRADQVNVSKGMVAKYYYENRQMLDNLVSELRWAKIADTFISHMTVKEVTELSQNTQQQPAPEAQPEQNQGE